MMQAIRSRAGSIIVKVLFALLIVSFGFWGIYTRSDYYQGHNPDTIIATIGDARIRAEDLTRALQPALERLRAQTGASIDMRQVKQLGILDSLLAQLIDRSLLDQETQRLGLEVSDEGVKAAIYDNPAFRGPDGRFDRQLFAQVLTVNRLTEDQLINRLRHDIPRSDLLQAITAGVGEPRPVVDILYRYRNEKRVADIVAFPAASVTGIGQPDDAALSQFYDSHPDMFRAPEYRGFTLASLSPSDLPSAAEIPEEKLRREYEQRKDEFEIPDRREIEQILAPSEEKAKEAEAALAAGKEWKEVATSIAGQDPDTIDLGLLNRQEIPRLLGDIAFELPLNEPSQPVKSPLGWHILRVTKIEPAATQSFEEVKRQIESELKTQDAVDRLDKIGNQADDLLAGGTPLPEVAGKFGLKTLTVAAVDEAGKDSKDKPLSLPLAPGEILKTVFATQKGDTSRIIDAQDGSIYAIRVDNVTPPQVRPLAEVKDQAVAGWQAEQKRESATKQAEALGAAVTPDRPLAKTAAEKKLALLPAVSLLRSPPGQQAPPALIAKLFAAKPGDVVTTSDQTGAHVAQLKTIESPENVPDDAAAKLAGELAGEAKVSIAGAFTEALRRRYPVEIQKDALDRMF
jgi:peptidyl-prolyl cis-trans isomerase D